MTMLLSLYSLSFKPDNPAAKTEKQSKVSAESMT